MMKADYAHAVRGRTLSRTDMLNALEREEPAQRHIMITHDIAKRY